MICLEYKKLNSGIEPERRQLLVKMMENHPNSLLNECELAIDKSAIYCIRVIGFLDESWSERLGGMTIAASSQEGDQTVTTLSGKLIDQAALFGVLKTLYDMRLPLLSVECLQVN